MILVDGKAIAGKIIEDLKQRTKPDKMLAAVLVGENAQSKSFMRQKEKMAQALEIPFRLYQFGESILQGDLIAEIGKLGADPEIGGIIVQLPLPPHYDRDAVLAAINPRKDIDAMTPESRKFVDPLPVAVVKEILKTKSYNLKAKTVAVVGRGFLVGKPVMEWLNQSQERLVARPDLQDKSGLGFDGKCKEVLLFHRGSDLSQIKDADLVITGVGKAGLITPEMLKPGAGVIDFGYDMKNGKIFGDFDGSNVNGQTSNVSFYTPTPGGTGPILVAEIYKNFFKLNS